MNKPTPIWKITTGGGTDVLLAPAGAALIGDFGGKFAKGGGLAGGDCTLVHKTDDGKLAVLCVPARKESGNSLLGISYRQLPKRPGNTASVSVIVDPNTNLLAKHCYTRHSGCLILSQDDQIYAWLILTEPVEITHSQVSTFSTTAGPRVLPAQDLTGPSARGPYI